MPLTAPKNAKEQRRDNAFTVLSIIRSSVSGVSRRFITEVTGLSYPAVNDIVEYLESFGLLEKYEGRENSRKTVLLYRFTGGKYAVLGLTALAGQFIGVCSDLTGNIQRRFEISRREAGENFTETLKARFQEMKADAEVRGLRILGMGIGVPGLINSETGEVLYADRFHELESVPLRNIFSEFFGVPVFLEHNPAAAAFAEKRLGAARDFSEFLYIILDSGIGGSLFYANRMFRGSAGFLGELGHSSVQFDGRSCGCGSRGCLELYAGRDVLNQKVNSCESEEEREKVLDEAVEYLAPLVGSLVCFLGVGNVVFSGKTLEDYPALFYKIRQFLLTRTLPVFRPDVSVQRSTLEYEAFPLGAALWAGEIALSNLSSMFFGEPFPDLELRMDGVMQCGY